MKRISFYGLLGMAICFNLISCGNKSKELTRAPRTQQQVGLIASCTTKPQAKKLVESLGGQFRVINHKKRLIEFVGISQEVLKSHLPKAKFFPNKLFKNEDITPSTVSSFSTGNIQFFGPHSHLPQGKPSSRFFPHLTQIQALDVDSKGEGVIIAILDTGVYYNHPHLSPNILTNPNDKHGDGSNDKDDDNNGLVNDYVGWDFYQGDAFPIDDNGHGTHVAGLAASTLMGVAPKAKILPIKVLGPDGGGDLGTITAGILYALEKKADIINLSLGGPGASEINSQVQSIINAVQLANKNGSLIVAAAGNGGEDGIGDCNDESPVYPANINSENLIAVASVDANNELTEYSNYGKQTVHIAAPGGDPITGRLNSTAIPFCQGPCNEDETPYRGSAGTSMATPLVSGLAALIKSKFPNLSAKEIKDRILNSGTQLDHLSEFIQTSRVINVSQSLSL